jgi:transposase-like protein
LKKERKNYTPQEKVAILRRHLIEKEPVSDICEKLDLQPTVFYRWLKEWFEHGSVVFESRVKVSDKKRKDKQEERIAKLEEKLRTKNEVMAELMEEHVILKKTFGEI